MLGKEPSEVTKPERQNIGKVTELALGFQGGVGAMMKMSGGRVDFTGMYESLCETMGSHQDKAAEAYKRRGEGLSREGWIAAEMMKLSWRALHPNIERFWCSLTEALVMDAPGQVSEAHWNEEAKAILGGLIMFCVCREEKNRRALATVREYLTLPPERLRALLELMQDSDAANGLVARAANRFLGKADREAASVLSNAQRHTHFLDSRRIARVLSRSDFHFSELRHRITSVFPVLPPNRMDAYSRWLRLLVSQALPGHRTRDAERPSATLAAPVGAQGASQRLKASNPTLGPAPVPFG